MLFLIYKTMLTKTLFTIIFATISQSAILHHQIQEAHDKFNDSYEQHMRAALSQANEEFKNFSYKIKKFQLAFNWSHGSIPTNQIQFDLTSSDDNKLCSFDFSVESFQDHLIESLENQEKFRAQANECSAEVRKFQVGPTTKVEEIVTELKELNDEIQKPHSVETIEMMRDNFYTIIDNAGDAALKALEILNEEQNVSEETLEEIEKEQKQDDNEVFGAIRALIESEEEIVDD